MEHGCYCDTLYFEDCCDDFEIISNIGTINGLLLSGLNMFPDSNTPKQPKDDELLNILKTKFLIDKENTLNGFNNKGNTDFKILKVIKMQKIK